MKKVTFEVLKKDKASQARLGVIKTPHGDVRTPAFVPVATVGSVKALEPHEVRECGFEMILSNTYHLHLRPGEDLIDEYGGIAKFIGWDGSASADASSVAEAMEDESARQDGPARNDSQSSSSVSGGPMITDSGGYQVFSLGAAMEEGIGKVIRKGAPDSLRRARLNKITEEGVRFQSHIDGKPLFLSPEISIAIQEKIGADLIVAFDDLESPNYTKERTLESLEMTERWLLRSKKAQTRDDQLLYGVTHGGEYEDLRVRSAKFNNEHFDAIALGGAHRDPENIAEVVSWTIPHLDDNKPRHLLGVGEIEDFFRMVPLGIDTFDCVVPTRLARVGWFFVHPREGNRENRFRKLISKAEFANSHEALSGECECRVCKQYTRGYIHHLFRSRELLAYKFLTYHNLYFFGHLMEEIRNSLEVGKFEELRAIWL